MKAFTLAAAAILTVASSFAQANTSTDTPATNSPTTEWLERIIFPEKYSNHAKPQHCPVTQEATILDLIRSA